MILPTVEEVRRLSTADKAELDRLLSLPPNVASQRDPIGWMVHTLKVPETTLRWSLLPEYQGHVWDGTPDPLCAIAEGIAAGEDVGVESGTGTGKTFLAAALNLWFLQAFEDALAITTAPVEKQLKAQLWKELGRFWGAFHGAYPMASMVDLRVRLREGAGEHERWAILGYGCGVDADAKSATRAQGFHAAHMLITTEETPGIDDAVMTALRNTCTGDHNVQLALGNPDFQLDTLHQFCIRPGVRHVRISALDHPNVVCGREIIPGAAGRKSIADKLATYGTVEHPLYRSRVRGISPAEASDALIRLEWCHAAAVRHGLRKLTADDLPALGVDVAQSEAGDKAAIARGRGNWLKEVESFQCPNATQLGRDVAKEAKVQHILPARVGVDAIAVGAATVNALREELGAITAIYSGASPIHRAQRGADDSPMDWVPDANQFKTLRSQMWWQLREDLRTNAVDLPMDPELFRQLTMPKFKDEGNVVTVEPKAETKKRLGRSPDDADAVVYWNWVRPRLYVKPAPTPTEQDRHPGFDALTKDRKHTTLDGSEAGRPTALPIRRPSFRRSD